MKPKARIRKLETKRKQNEPTIIVINWDDTIEPKPGETVINWEDDGEVKTQNNYRENVVRFIWKPHRPAAKPDEAHKTK